MALLNLDLTGNLAIDQGYEWRATLIYPGDFRLSQLRGKIFTSFEEDAEELAAFQFRAAPFDKASQTTRIAIWLTATQTESLPLTEGNNRSVYQIRLTSSGRSPISLMRGSVQVLPVLPL
ncbi:MAG: hypothetical protein F6K28_15750 [Microcoleus sp. SIO2G3]|nr:hypothetical protein [Microcoleus sp. SIO2G3]